MKSPTLCLALLLWLAAWPTPGVEAAAARRRGAGTDGLQHCIGPDGVTIYTDRRCSDLQAVEQVRRPSRPSDPACWSACAVAPATRTTSCLGRALGAGKPRREPARRVLPLVRNGHGRWLPPDGAARRLRRAAPGRCPTGFEPGAGNRHLRRIQPDPEVIDPFAPGDAETVAPAPRPRHPADLLRVDQMGSSEDLGIQATYFHLRSNAGCWWMQF